MRNTKHTKTLLILLSSLFLIFASCSQDVVNQNNENKVVETGTTTVKMYVPDYYAMADSSSRAIAPQTAYARLSYQDDEISEWISVNKIALADAEKTEINSENADFPGYIYTFSFEKVYAQEYAAGTLKIELLDSSENLITSGTNLQKVTVASGERTGVTFYTVPSDLCQSDSFLNKGQMKFYSYTFKAGKKYFIHDVVNSGSDYPDLVFFNNNGTLDEYYAVDSEEDSVIEISPYSEDTTKIIGIWADDNTYISRYTINVYPELLGIEFSENTIDICKDETYQVTVKTIPEGAYLGDVTYSSSNDLITVDQNGVVSTASTDNELLSSTITASYYGFTATMTANFAKGTNLLGTISGDDLHWTKEGSPYRIKGDILVTEGSTLVIDPGVTVRFASSYRITVRGEIQARGTSSEPVIFTGKSGVSNVQWNGISVGGSDLVTENTYTYVSGNIIEYCNFEYAGTPLTIGSGTYVNHCKFSNSNNVQVNNSNSSVFINNEFNDGVNMESCSANFENNVVKNYFRVYTWCGNAPIVKHNSFYNCTFYPELGYFYNYDIGYAYNTFSNSVIYIGYNSDEFNMPFIYNNFADSSIQVESGYCSESSYNFTNNYWGENNTTTLNSIGNNTNTPFIYDYFDNSGYSRVDYSNWLTEPVEKCGYLGDAFIGFDISLSALTGTNPDSYSPYIVVSTKIAYAENEIIQIRFAENVEALKEAQWQTYSSEYQYKVDLSEIVTADIPIYVQIRDANGNESPVISKKISCTGDRYLDFIFKVNGSTAEYSNFKETSNPVMTITVIPGYHVHEISKYRISQIEYIGAEGIPEIDNVQWYDYTDSFEYTIDEDSLSGGYAYIAIQLQDSEGAVSSTSVHVIPFGAPIISCSNVNNKIYTDEDETVEYCFNISDGGKIRKYQLYVDTALVQSDSNNWETSIDINRYIGLKYMSAGTHTITLKVWDEAKNVGIKQVPFTITHSETVDTSSLEGNSWDTTTGQPLKDERTAYLWHLDSSGVEVDDLSAGLSEYTSAIGGFGSGCASRIYTNDSVSLDVSTNEFTVEYWIKSSNQNDRPYLYMNKDGSVELNQNWEYFYYFDETNSLNNKNYWDTQRPESDAEWHYVAKVFNGSYFANYIDGVLTNYSENIDIELNNSDGKLHMELQNADAVDEIRISNAARSADEITAYYNAAKIILDNSYGSLSGIIY